MSYNKIREAFLRVLKLSLDNLPENEPRERILNVITSRDCTKLIVNKGVESLAYNNLLKKIIDHKLAKSYFDSDEIWIDLKNIFLQYLDADINMLVAIARTENISTSQLFKKITVDYDFHRAFGTPILKRNRPYVEVVINGPTGKNERLYCLLDTGADEMMIDESVAKNVGINLAAGNKKSIKTATGGSATATIINNVEMDIEGRRITELCYFIKGGIQLIGRNTILSALEFGMNTKGWLGKS